MSCVFIVSFTGRLRKIPGLRPVAVRHVLRQLMLESPPIPIVCAVIEKDGRVLLAQRPAHKHLALKWEFAGGKVESDEEPAAALIREIREELGCAIAIVHPLPRFTHRYADLLIEMFPFVCRLAPGAPEPQAHEHVALAWVLPGELPAYDLAAADLPVVAAYRGK